MHFKLRKHKVSDSGDIFGPP